MFAYESTFSAFYKQLQQIDKNPQTCPCDVLSLIMSEALSCVLWAFGASLTF